MQIYAFVMLLFGLYFLFSVSRYAIAFRRLPSALPAGDRPLPKVTVVIPACNEEATIRAGVTSWLRQEYPAMTLLLVNDRSTDGTGRIIDELAALQPERVRALHVTELPQGWLGKNHALWLASQQAEGEWLLFTDADVAAHPDTVRRAVAYSEQNRLDHLTLAPEIVSATPVLRGFVAFFIWSIAVKLRLHEVNDPKSRTGVGFGAFSLLRRRVYMNIGGHTAISLRPDDDVSLGQRVKSHGFRQNALDGGGAIKVQWYSTLPELVRGVEKNMFSVFEYSLPMALGSVLVLATVLIAPYALLPFARGWTLPVLLAGIGTQWAGFLIANWQQFLVAAQYLLVLPLLAALFLWVVLRSCFLTLRQKGIYWRGTFYPLAALRSQRCGGPLPVRK